MRRKRQKGKIKRIKNMEEEEENEYEKKGGGSLG